MKRAILLCFSLCVLLTACVATRTLPVPVKSETLTGDEELIQGDWVVIHSEMSRIALPEMKGRVYTYFGRQFRIDQIPAVKHFVSTSRLIPDALILMMAIIHSSKAFTNWKGIV
jgi:hypothetical protein